MADMKKGFNLADVLKDVSSLDTGNREQIEYIDLSLIDSDPNNFYELSEIDKLAANIELVGLQQPLRVRDNPEAPGRVMIVSGHRRRAAVQMLVDDGREDLRQVPCIRDAACNNPALQELRLIYANADTRKMSPADQSRQVERVEQLLYQLKEAGYEFPGRMRDHVAEACNISRSKLARLKVIRDRLDSNWEQAFESGLMKETVAYAMAQLPGEHQRAIWKYWTSQCKEIKNLYEGTVKSYGIFLAAIDKLRCHKDEGVCVNANNKFTLIAGKGWDYCSCSSKCCKDCSDLVSCKYACPKLADKVKQLKEQRKEDRKNEKQAQEERERPVIEQIQNLWHRFGQARNAADVSVENFKKHLGHYFFGDEEQKYVEKECLEAKFTTQTELPYGYDLRLSGLNLIVKTAQLFGCSTDYLLGLSDQMQAVETDSSATPQNNTEQPSVMWYSREVEPPVGVKIVVVTEEGWAENNRYAGGGYLDDEGVTQWKEVHAWTFMPGADVQVGPSGMPVPKGAWFDGSVEPEEALDAVAYFEVGDGKIIRKLVHWNGIWWVFPSGTIRVEAVCVKWLPLPSDDPVGDS